MNLLDLCALTPIGRMTGVRFQSMRTGSPVPDYPFPHYAAEDVTRALRAERVQLHPCTDAWMRGDRYGEVVRETAETVTVKMDRSGKTRRYPQAFVLTLDGGPR